MRFAPRYDPRILEALHALDDRMLPIAEISRRVGAEAEKFDLTRPSYVHLRRLVVAKRLLEDAERARRDEIREIVVDVVSRIATGRFVDAYDVASRVEDAYLREELAAQSHKAP